MNALRSADDWQAGREGESASLREPDASRRSQTDKQAGRQVRYGAVRKKERGTF